MSIDLTQEDISRLILEPSAKVRSEIVEKVCGCYHAQTFTHRERELASDIFQLLLKDTEIRVRQTLAKELLESPEAPPVVMRGLALDSNNDIASSVLENSPVLTDEDLIAITAATQNVVRLVAIASRKILSSELSGALLDKNEGNVAKTLISNEGANLNEECLEKLIVNYQQDQSIMEDLVCRGGLPYEYCEQLFAIVSDTMTKQLTKRNRLNWGSANKELQAAREVATLRFLSPWMSPSDLESLVDHMHRNKRLTNNVIMQSLYTGNVRFFESAMAKRVEITQKSAHTLLCDPGVKGFTALYKEANMPEEYTDAVNLLYQLAVEETVGAEYHTEEISERLVSRIVEEGHDKTTEKYVIFTLRNG